MSNERSSGASEYHWPHHWFALGAISGALSLFSSAAAYGADASATADTGTASGTLEEVVVTARRKSEALEDVPETVSAVTPSELQKLNLQNLTDISGVVTGLQVINGGQGYNDTVTLRGVSFNPATGTQDTVAFYINDVPVVNNFVTTTNFDVGQIEVLSGPQGTLRGEPAPSGSVTITTHRPDLQQFGGYVTLTGTQYDNFNGNGAVNLPLWGDKLALRLAAIADDSDFDGVKSINNAQTPYLNTYGERASLRFEPVNAIELNVMYQYVYSHQSSYEQVAGPGATGGLDPLAPANYNGPAISGTDRQAVQTYPTQLFNATDIFTGQLDWHVAGQELSYVGSRWKYALTGDNTTLGANQAPGINAGNMVPYFVVPNTPLAITKVQTDELRLSSETPLFGLLDYTVGLFYRDETDTGDSTFVAAFLPGSFGSPLGNTNPFVYNPAYTWQGYSQSPKEEKEISEFAHLTFHLPDDTELAVGGRYLHYKQTGFIEATLNQGLAAAALPIPCSLAGFTSTYAGTCNVPLPGGAALPYTPTNLTDHASIYNISLSHKFSPSLMAYLSSGSSWRPPALSVGIDNAANDPTLNSLLHLRSETSYSFEGGFKWKFLQDRARVNLSYYHQKFEHFIYEGLPTVYVADTGASSTATAFSFNSNPDAVVNGVNFDSGFQFTRQWSFDLAASYSNGHLTGSQIPCNPPSGGTTLAAFPPGTYIYQCPSHASTSISPNFNARAQSEYDVPVTGLRNVDGFVRGLYTFYGRNPHASEFYVAPSYGILNLYMGLRSADGAWEGALFAKNLLNTQKLLSLGYPAITTAGLDATFGSSGYYPPGGPLNAAPMLTPRQEVGATVTYSFGSK